MGSLLSRGGRGPKSGENSGGDDEPKKPSAKILQQELKEALNALNRPTNRLFFSGLSAGLELGFSLFLIGVVQSLTQGDLPPAMVRLLVANMYSFGFILVILGRSELFTEQTSLAVLPILNRMAKIRSLVRLWSIVFVANILGAAVSAALISSVGTSLGVIDQEVLVEIAQRLTHHPAHVIVMSGILAGWLMGLLGWLVAAGRDTISQIVIVWLITAAIGLGHLHHSILGSVEVLAGMFVSSEVTMRDFGHFLLWASVGNATGGPLFLALLKTAQARPD